MAMLLNSPGGGGRRRKRPLQSEINVTPFVDVMLVLLVVFMITAPLLTQGVEVDLPKTKANNLPSATEQPLSITLKSDGTIFIQEEQIEANALIPKLQAIVGTGYEERIYVRGDQSVAYGDIMRLLTRLQRSGFSNVSLVTDPEGE